MQKMICERDLEYPPGTHLKPGDEFEVEDLHVPLFLAIGRARLLEQPRQKRAYTRHANAGA